MNLEIIELLFSSIYNFAMPDISTNKNSYLTKRLII